MKSNWDLKTIYDVIAKMPGSETPEQWVIRGNHHDAWVNGADDPISGMVVELEEARALGELVKQGWRPKRTIIYCAWDGEEPGLLGSTEWVEQHQEELRQHAVMYLNTDSSARGIGVSGSHTLERAVNQVEREIRRSGEARSVWKRAYLRRVGRAASPEDREELRDRADLRLGALGDGSDYTAFLDYTGVAALNMGFGGESGGGVYHSIYDDFYWYTHFGDPKFVYERALAQVAGSTVMRFADADLLPFDPTGSADAIKRCVAELKKELKQQQDQARERNREVEEGVFTATADPEKQYVPPAERAGAALLELRPAGQWGGSVCSRGAALSPGGREIERQRRRSVAISRVAGNQRQAAVDREDLHRQPGSQGASLVQASDLCSWRVYRLWSQDDSRSARGDGRTQMERRR